jgi:flagellar hook-basal body complex protein FliE
MDISTLNNMPLYSLNQVTGSESQNSDSSGAQNEELSFSQIINQKLEEAISLQKEADQLTESFSVGEPVEIHQMLIAMEKADLALRQAVEIRNKVIEAYQEIERMQI